MSGRNNLRAKTRGSTLRWRNSDSLQHATLCSCGLEKLIIKKRSEQIASETACVRNFKIHCLVQSVTSIYKKVIFMFVVAFSIRLITTVIYRQNEIKIQHISARHEPDPCENLTVITGSHLTNLWIQFLIATTAWGNLKTHDSYNSI